MSSCILLNLSKGFFSYVVLAGVLFISCNKDLSKEASAALEVPVVEVVQKDVPLYQEFVGQIYGERDIPIIARVEGFLNGIHFQEGSKVKKGQLLYTIDAEPFIAKVNAQKSVYAEGEIALNKAKSDLERYKPLADMNAVSKSDLDAKQAQYDASVSSLEAAQANLKSTQIELGYTNITSPIDGIIGVTQAKVGEFVGRSPNPVILNTVSRTDSIRVRFFIPETEYLAFAKEYEKDRASRKVAERRPLKLYLSDGSLYPYSGQADFLDRNMNISTGSILVQATFPNPEGLLRPGLFAKIKVEVKMLKNALLIPQRCIMELQGQHSVYVVKNDNTVEGRQIKLLERVGDMAVVTQGLQAGDKLVIDALQKVRTGATINPKDSDFKSMYLSESPSR